MDIKRLKDFVLSFIFTKRCRYCNNICSITDEICSNCQEDIHTIDGEICFNCGLSKLLCAGKERKHYYESVCAPYYYAGAPRLAVLHLKHQNTPRVLYSLCDDMLSCIKLRYGSLDFDMCTYVPMHPADENERGYNQSKLIAEKIAEELNIPCYELLKKDYKTKSQHALPQIMRSGNLLGSISFNKDCSIDIKDTRILLCDDIKTTGSTLDECSKTLLFEECAEVRCITACISYDNKDGA